MTQTTIQRFLNASIKKGMQDTPIIVMNGARQVGKSTLANAIIDELRSQGKTAQYLSFDDPAVFASAAQSPVSFVEGLHHDTTVIDEVQRVPEIFLPLKQTVDRSQKPGQFILTGSANVFNLPKIADSLAGRKEVHTLWGLSQDELLGKPSDFLSWVFASHRHPTNIEGQSEETLIKTVLQGGYPAVRRRPTLERQHAWFNHYITSILQKDVRDVSNITDLAVIPILLELLATRSGSLVNYASLSRAIKLSAPTLKTYLTILETLYLVKPIRAWSNNLGKRLLKASKIYLADTGVLAHQLKIEPEKLYMQRNLWGHLLENFVISELLKQMSWSQKPLQIYYFRNVNNQEVDVVLERNNGDIVAIEIKARQQVDQRDFKGIQVLKKMTPDRFKRGIVLYLGKHCLKFGQDMWALPVNSLWEL